MRPGLAKLAVSCSLPLSLNLSNCIEVTDEGLAKLAVSCSQLSSLDLSYIALQ